MIKVTQQYPAYGTNYGPGWIGFKATRKGFIAAGINWFEHWDNISKVPVEHTLNIASDDLTIEALEDGVDDGSLRNYLLDPDVALLVRKPRQLSLDLARAIVDEAGMHLGEPYNNRLIAAMALSSTFLGHALSRLTCDRTERWLCWLADRRNEWICSKLVRTSLAHPPYTQYHGVMQMPPYTVKPIDLFEDVFVFEPGAIELLPFTQPLNNP